jgi:hypothetical protein
VDLGGRQWDVAVGLATSEHLPDVQAFARRLREVVVPGGLAIVMTNDERSSPYDIARVARRVGYRTPFERLYDRHHLNHFNTKSLRTLMARHGFRLREVRRHNIPLAAVDMPKESAVLRAGVWAHSPSSAPRGRTFLQTLVLENS